MPARTTWGRGAEKNPFAELKYEFNNHRFDQCRVHFWGVLIGLWLRKVLPEHHLDQDSKDTVKLGAGMIATLTALVLGLLVSSAKSSFDAMNTGITQGGAKIILLDRVLAHYGPETKAVRDELRRSVIAGIEMVWPEQKKKSAVSGLSAWESATAMEHVQDKLRALTPQNEAQRQRLSQAVQLSGDLSQTRWLLFVQTQIAIPTPFLVVLLFWLTMLYVSFGLFAPRNATVITVLLICALSVSAAIFFGPRDEPSDGGFDQGFRRSHAQSPGAPGQITLTAPGVGRLITHEGGNPESFRMRSDEDYGFPGVTVEMTALDGSRYFRAADLTCFNVTAS